MGKYHLIALALLGLVVEGRGMESWPEWASEWTMLAFWLMLCFIQWRELKKEDSSA